MHQKPHLSVVNTTYDPNDGRVVFDMKDIAAMLWRGKGVVVLCAIVVAAFAFWHVFFNQVPMYGSDAQIVVETRNEQILDLENVLSNLSTSEEALRTESLILNGRHLMGMVVDELGLTKDPEFNPFLIDQPQSPIAFAKAFIKDAIKDAWLEKTAVATEHIAVPEALDPEVAQRSAAVSTLQKAVTIRNIPNTYAFSIWVVTQDPYKSQRIANAIANLYIQDQLAAKYDATTQASAWLSEQAALLESDLKRSEQELSEFSNTHNFVTPEEIENLEYRIVQLRRSLQDKQNQLAVDERNLERMHSASDQQSREQIATELGLISDASQAQITSVIWDAFKYRIQEDIRTTTRLIQGLQEPIRDLEGQISNQRSALLTLEEKQQDTAAKQMFYESVRNRLQETSIQTGLQRADIRITSYATLLPNPISPQKSRMVGLGLFFGALLGSGLVLARNVFAPKVSSAARLTALTFLPVIASLPILSRSTRLQRIQTPRKGTFENEAVRGLRNAIRVQKTPDGRAPQVILVTSASSGEGKTTIATATANSFAQAGRRVLLIDCDTRRGTASLRLTNKPTHALTDVLHDHCDLDSAVLSTEIQGLDILPAFSSSSRAQGVEALNRPELNDILKQAREEWDIVILDTPPAMVISDTLLLAEKADLLLLVAAVGETSEADVSHCLEKMRQFGQTPDAIILNKSKNKREIYGLGRKAKQYYKNLQAA